MGYWIFMFCTSLLIPISMLGFGKRFKKKAPGSINMLFGYRTTMSMKNQDTWTFAHQYFGKLWYQWGWVTLILTVVPMLLALGKGDSVIGTVGSVVVLLQLLPVIGVIFPVEKALRKNFDKDGNRKR